MSESRRTREDPHCEYVDDWCNSAEEIAAHMRITRQTLHKRVRAGDPVGKVIIQAGPKSRWRARKRDLDRVMLEEYRSVG